MTRRVDRLVSSVSFVTCRSGATRYSPMPPTQTYKVLSLRSKASPKRLAADMGEDLGRV